MSIQQNNGTILSGWKRKGNQYMLKLQKDCPRLGANKINGMDP